MGSEIQNARDQLFADTAEGQYLTIVGNNYGVPRPTRASDDLFRLLIPKLSLSPKSIIKSIHDILTVYFGVYAPREQLNDALPIGSTFIAMGTASVRSRGVAVICAEETLRAAEAHFSLTTTGLYELLAADPTAEVLPYTVTVGGITLARPTEKLHAVDSFVIVNGVWDVYRVNVNEFIVEIKRDLPTNVGTLPSATYQHDSFVLLTTQLSGNINPGVASIPVLTTVGANNTGVLLLDFSYAFPNDNSGNEELLPYSSKNPTTFFLEDKYVPNIELVAGVPTLGYTRKIGCWTTRFHQLGVLVHVLQSISGYSSFLGDYFVCDRIEGRLAVPYIKATPLVDTQMTLVSGSGWPLSGWAIIDYDNAFLRELFYFKRIGNVLHVLESSNPSAMWEPATLGAPWHGGNFAVGTSLVFNHAANAKLYYPMPETAKQIAGDAAGKGVGGNIVILFADVLVQEAMDVLNLVRAAGVQARLERL